MNQLFTALLAIGMMTAMSCQAAQKSDTFTTKSGKTVTITHIKHASIQIDYDGQVIYVDPVGSLIKPETDFTQYPKANIILITHEHRDHFDQEAIFAVRTPATHIFLNQRTYNELLRGQVMKNGDVRNISSDIILEAVPAYNTTEGREQFHPQGRDNGYVLTLDGLRIYIAGDTEDIPEMANLKDIDIAFLSCNQPYTMTPEQLVKAANTIKPRVLFPYHYSDTPIGRVSILMKGSDIDLRIRDYK